MLRVSLRNLVAHKLRFLLTVAAVTLGVGFVSGTGPDVFNVGSPGVSQMAGPGFVLPLDSYQRVKREAADFFQSKDSLSPFR